MMKKENFLDKKPILKSSLTYRVSEDDIVTLEVENKGFMNKIAQKLFNKPKISYIHLDEIGSYAIICSDGVRDIGEIGSLVYEKFGEKANPLYERLSKFFQVMDSYSFIEWM